MSVIDSFCYVYREPGDPAIRPNNSKNSWSSPGWYGAESRLLHNVKRILNERGYELIKKRMWKDGHMFGTEHAQYVRSRVLKTLPSIYIYNADAALEIAPESYNVLGRVRLDVVYGTGREDDPDFERACRDRVREKESVHSCYQVSWEDEATIDGSTAVRRLYRGFSDLDKAGTFFDSHPGDSCRLIDRRTGKKALVHEIA